MVPVSIYRKRVVVLQLQSCLQIYQTLETFLFHNTTKRLELLSRTKDCLSQKILLLKYSFLYFRFTLLFYSFFSVYSCIITMQNLFASNMLCPVQRNIECPLSIRSLYILEC